MLKLAIIVVSFNTVEKTLRCLKALADDVAGIDSEIWVVDNGSSDGSAEAISSLFPMIHLIRSKENLGFGRANNLAINQLNGDRILLLNSDAFLRPGSILALSQYLDTHKSVAAVGPRLLNPDGSLQISCFKFPGPMRSAFDFLLITAALPNHPVIGDYRRWKHDSERIVDFVSGACLMVRRSVFSSVGLFDESFFFYFEEADWCMRATHDGWQIGFTPSAEVIHEGGGSANNNSENVFRVFQVGHQHYIRKHYGQNAARVVRAMLGIGAAMRILIFGIRHLLGFGNVELVRRWKRIFAWTLGFE